MQSRTRSRRWAIRLPEPFKFPKPNRTGCVVVGSIVFVSGHGRYNGPTPGIKTVGKLGRDLTIEEGYATARLAALSILSSLKQELGELERIKRLVRLMGMVNVTPGFDRMPEVIDGASDFFYELLGRRTASTRAPPSGLPNSRTAFRSRSTGNSRFEPASRDADRSVGRPRGGSALSHRDGQVRR